MPRKHTVFALLIGTIALAALTLTGAGKNAFVIQNARVHTLGSAGTLERGSVAVVDGKIAAVGVSVKTPPGARIVDGKGLEVYPGMVNAGGNLGLTEIGAVDVTNDYQEQGNYKPQLLAFSALHPASEHIPVARVGGVTASLSLPAGGVIAGQATLFHLDGWTADEMAILKSAGMVVNFPSLGGQRGPRGMGFGRTAAPSYADAKRTFDNQVKELSEWLEKARHYAAARKANPGTDADLQLEALVPVVEGRLTAFVSADSSRDIRNAVEFAKKEKLRIVLFSGPEAGKEVDLLKKEGIPVVLGPVIALPRREDDPYDAPFTAARDLAKAGVKFAISARASSDVRNLPHEAGYAQAFGLTHADALKAVTLFPAEILGVSDRIGSIEQGKVADLVVTDGDLLEMRTKVKHLFIGGKPVSLETRHTRLYEEYLARP